MTRHGRRSVLLILALVNASASAQSDKFPLPPATTTPEPTETAPAAPPSAPAAATGRVVVRGLQGTPDGPPIADAPVRLQLVHRGAVVQSRDGRSDERGVAVFEELPVDIGVLPVVQIEYAGVSYQQPGQMMDARLAEQTVDVTCFEVTTEQPPWSVATRHVMLDRVPGGVRVAEIVVIENPAPRTWLGIAGPVAEGRPCTTQLPLPTGAAGVTLGGGFHDWCCTTLAAGRLFNHLPMMPATTELRFGYVVPAGADGRVELDLVAPAAVGNTMVVFPEDLEAESAQGLVFGGTDDAGEQRVQYYQTGAQQPGQSVRLVLTGLSSAASGTAPPVASPAVKIIAAVGGLLLVVTAIVVVSRPRRAGTDGGS